ncbi:MAG: cysteine desulfurase [Victivallales bacterium]|nr:cysteine desulfurase [Victivallales bacterium]
MNNPSIYADHAATTPLLPKALEAMLPYLRHDFGNPSSLYHRGQETHKAVEVARATIGRCISAKTDEILFTSGGTESDNWALEGIARTLRHKGKHIVVSAIEHHAVLNCCKMLENDGYKVTYLPVSSTGRVESETLEKVLQPDTILVSIMLANNEIGTIQDIPSLASIAHRKGVLFHTDAVQAVGHIRVDVRRLCVDLLSASAHKFNGPQGCGFLYVKNGTPIQPFHLGGQQERGLRAGTENVAGIVGMAIALEHNVQNLLQRKRHLGVLERNLRELL